MKTRVLSGIRPTGMLHLGNYFGAVKGMIQLQDDPDRETLYMVADLHAITTPYDPRVLRADTRSVVMSYLAAGLNPEKSTLFVQSDLAEYHAQLSFYFSSVTSVARMQHLPTYKDKIRQHPDNVTMALLNYPLLMAADILVYKAGLVPVGLDQEPHIEVAREIARKMNAVYGLNFPEPERFATSGEYVPSLSGEGKMSKSVVGSYISVLDDLPTIQKSLARAPTDSGTGVNEDMPVSVKNLLQLVELFQGSQRRQEYEVLYTSSGIRYGDLKKELAQAIYTELEPIQQKYRELEKSSEYVEQVIAQGAGKARQITQQTIDETKQAMGFG